ncbi:hypothetical protein CPLU01_12460 [Colletotrichum plurivorum]|uniref:Uncharacterized protein n=1 Tax=Colletotrichum plurivorum TaxID=2175906 RepID=A0A8H6N6J7_9PEZI|nr:hypothetical protein CPLU01_12460 [Colletotrichum plurivorum]
MGVDAREAERAGTGRVAPFGRRLCGAAGRGVSKAEIRWTRAAGEPQLPQIRRLRACLVQGTPALKQVVLSRLGPDSPGMDYHALQLADDVREVVFGASLGQIRIWITAIRRTDLRDLGSIVAAWASRASRAGTIARARQGQRKDSTKRFQRRGRPDASPVRGWILGPGGAPTHSAPGRSAERAGPWSGLARQLGDEPTYSEMSYSQADASELCKRVSSTRVVLASVPGSQSARPVPLKARVRGRAFQIVHDSTTFLENNNATPRTIDSSASPQLLQSQ